MKPKVTFFGRVTENANFIQPQGKKPFVAYLVEGFKNKAGWSTTVACIEYHDQGDQVAKTILAGQLVLVAGDVSADAYMSKKKPGTPVGKLKVFVREREVVDIGGAEEQDEPQENTSAPQPQPSAAGAPAAPEQPQGESGDDCPY